MMDTILKLDCLHFPGSRPCAFNKTEGITCPGCVHYTPKGFRILIVKLDAVGDVLRTTSLLPGLREKYPDAEIVWVTRARARDLFLNNGFVSEVWTVENDALARLGVERFDLVINPDADKLTSALAAAADCNARLGMTLDERGCVLPVNAEAIEWLQMGAFDELKKKNTKTYQQILYEMCGMAYARQPIVLEATRAEREWAGRFLSTAGVKEGESVIGLNLGGGERWKRKRWTEEHLLTFAGRVLSLSGFRLLLIGGPFERELIGRMLSKLPPGVISSGHDRTLRELAALVGQCASIITGDTLCLHVACALGVPVVALFGPTSAAEIELYGNGEKIVAGGCHACYLTDCDVTPNCMETITPEVVMRAMLGRLGIEPHAP
ncbi:MAG: glycosyltransferase family 9 protein [Deltaproteobacteria bacterium]|nr:glycosyltransferase family 9 protein [Deltaproteobacteria bacterium]